VEVGARLNRTEESRTVVEDGALRPNSPDTQTNTRVTGSAGLSWAFWQKGTDRVGVFTNIKNAFKPAAIDFGLDSEGAILKPETARSLELGVKATLFNGRLSMEVDAFRMDFENLVVPQANGALANAGKERFQGVEGEFVFRFRPDLMGRLSYSNHDTRFTDYAKDFGSGTLTQLAGKRLEMSPYHLGALGLVYAPAKGFTASVEANYVGGVYLNQRNTAPSDAYTTLAASLGYRTAAWEFRLTGQNLTDQRNPVAESELGDAQYYRLPGRQVDASVRFRF
jgi:iron complex outermembrane receptor protein